MVYTRAKQYNGVDGYWTDASIAFIQGGGELIKTFSENNLDQIISLGIRGNLNLGNITHYDLLTILPFDSRLVVIEITGKDLLLALEHSVHRYKKRHSFVKRTFNLIYQFTYHRYSETTGNGEFLQYSGIQVTYNLTQPRGSRVESVQVKCADCAIPRFYNLEENRNYKVITTSFLEVGGDSYTMFVVSNSAIK